MAALCLAKARNNPAYAGKRPSAATLFTRRQEQPRVRGEYALGKEILLPRGGTTPRARGIQLAMEKGSNAGGTAPRARGKVAAAEVTGVLTGNNPAHAGKRLHDQQVRHTTIGFSFNFVQLMRTRQERAVAYRSQRAWFVPDLPAPRRGMCRDRSR